MGTDYVIEGQRMRTDSHGPYGDGWFWDVLRNDKDSVIAIYAPKEHGANPGIYIWTLAINKVTGAFVSAQFHDVSRGAGIVNGRCYQGRKPGRKWWNELEPKPN